MSSALITKYRIELLCDYAEWWRYNVYIMAVGFDGDGTQGAFNNLVDKVYDAAYGGEPRSVPLDYVSPRKICLETKGCAYVEIYLYVVANTFPQSEVIGDSPSFDVVLRTSTDGRVVEDKMFEVNQWGGLTVVAHHIGL